MELVVEFIISWIEDVVVVVVVLLELAKFDDELVSL